VKRICGGPAVVVPPEQPSYDCHGTIEEALLAREVRRLAAIVVMDVVGYSRLMGQDESRTHALLRTHLAERVMPPLARHGGRLVKSTGDGVLVEFGSAVDALSAAIEIQQGMADANRGQPEADRIVFRAGVHLGDVIVEESDLYGDAVNIAARLQAEAEPGGILISRAVREAASGRLKAELQPVGELSLKNIARPVRAFRVDWNAADWTAAPAAQSSSPDAPSPVAPPATSALAESPSIAVLAFRNLSGDPAREYFADGVVEDIITTLSRIPNLVVIARNSSYSYKGRSVDVRQVGKELGARYVLDGSIRIAAGKLRINCLLIDATTGKQIWADRYDGAMEDVFDLQDRITSSIVATIYPKIQRAEIARAQAKPTDSLSAYDLYLRAMAGISHNPTESSTNQAIELLRRAIAADRQFAAAYGFLANAHWNLVINDWGTVDEAKARGFEAARLAVELGKDDPTALHLGGFGIAYLGGRLEEGLAHIERALTLNPNSIGAWRNAGTVCWMLGEHEKSIEYYERSLRLSPQDSFAFESYFGLAAPHFFLGRYEEALDWLGRALRESPRYLPALMFKVAALAMDGSHPDELRDTVQQLKAGYPDMSVTEILLRLTVSRSTDRELFTTALRKAGFQEQAGR
jgi:adenylate cyclase